MMRAAENACIRRWAILLFLPMVACTHAPTHPVSVSDEDRTRCLEMFSMLDAAIEAEEVVDTQARRIRGFPYLRINRFLTSYSTQPLSPSQYAQWVEQMRLLAEQGYQVEINNLGAKQRARLKRMPGLLSQPDLNSRVHHCSRLLLADLLQEPAKQRELKKRARVADEYQVWKKMLGLYPLTAMPFMAGIKSWHRKTWRVFNTPLESLPRLDSRVVYVPNARPPIQSKKLQSLLHVAKANPLGIPKPVDDDLHLLFDSFAPVLQIDVASRNDRIGRPHWAGEQVQVDVSTPVAYHLISWARMRDKVLLQLNYVFWFPSRPKTGVLDLLGGHLDGLIWRVTLDEDGRPLIYDSIHACGCYHMFFPTRRLQSLGSPPADEGALVPQRAPDLSGSERIVLHLASRTHYIRRLAVARSSPHASLHYELKDYDSLRSLPYKDGRKSMFGKDGIVAGSERLERILFWPMGVPKPGAMRQWGHHATAFVGRRHFDDPFLFTRYFRPSDGARRMKPAIR